MQAKHTWETACLENRLFPITGQILPLWVLQLNQMILFISAPFLKLLFPGNCAVYIVRTFKVHQLVNIVLFCKSVGQSMLVFVQSAGEVGGDTDIQNGIVPIGQNTNKIHSHYHSRRGNAAKPVDCSEIGAKIPRLARLARDDRGDDYAFLFSAIQAR